MSTAVVARLQRRNTFYWELLENIRRGDIWQGVKKGRLWDGRREWSLLLC
jgi:hypothetical protein